MNYRQIPPPDYLKPYIRYFWVLENDSPDQTASRSFAPIPDGCPGIIFHRSEKGAFLEDSGYALPELYLYGQTTTQSKIATIGSFKTIGVYFFPHAIRTVFGVSAYEVTNSCVSLELLCNRKFAELSERLYHAGSIMQQIEMLSVYFFELINRQKQGMDKVTVYALDQLMSSKGMLTLKDLQQDIGASERSIERKFNEFVGISPKLFSRVCRFQASLDHLRNRRFERLTDVAFESGYADQSHFIRSFKEFTGFSPEAYQQQSAELVENFPELLSK